MRSYELISASLSTLDGGTFQMLAARYVSYRYQTDECYHVGTKQGTTKPATGTPDARLYSNKLGGYIFVECGSVSGKSQAICKIREDVEKCLDAESLLTDGQLKAIVCCYSERRLSAEDLDSIKRIDPRIELIGPDEISEACDTICPWLAKEYLGIPHECAVSDLQSFIDHHEKSQFTSTLYTDLQGRDNELKSLTKCLNDSQAIILSGFSGVGKTRLAIEVCRTWAQKNAADLLAIKPWERNVVSAIRRCHHAGTACLLLIDDANELAELSELAHFLIDNSDVKAVLTVRGYAKDRVIDSLREIKNVSTTNVTPLDTERVVEILKDTQTRDGRVLAAISRIAHGNLRLALMACEQLGSSEPKSVMDLLEICYGNKLRFLSDNEKKAIEIASVLGPHLPDKSTDLPDLENLLSISHAQYLEACRSLCGKELMAEAGHFTCVKFEEQNLRDYFLHKAIIDDGLIKLKDLWGLSDGEHIAIRLANNLLHVYTDQETLEELKRQARPIWNDADSTSRLHIASALNGLIGIEGIAFLRGHIEQMKAETRVDCPCFDDDNSIHSPYDVPAELQAIQAFSTSFPDHAIALAFDLLQKTNKPFWAFKELFTQSFCMTAVSPLKHYDLEQRIITRLQTTFNATNDPTYAVLLIHVVEAVFSDQRLVIEHYDERTVDITTLTCLHNDGLLNARGQGISSLISLFDNPLLREQAIKALASYSPMPGGDGDRELALATLDLLLKQFVPHCPLDSLSSFRNLQQLRKQCLRMEMHCDEIDTAFGQSPAYKFIAVLTEYDYRNEDSWVKRVLSTGSQLSEKDWEELIRIAEQSSRSDVRVIERGLSLFFENNRPHDLRWTPFDRFTRSGIIVGRPYCEWVYRTYGAESGRAYLQDHSPAQVRLEFLLLFDRYVVLEMNDTSLYEEYLKSVSELEEVLPFDCVAKISRNCPEYFARYVNALNELPEGSSRKVLDFLPYRFTEYEFEPYLERSDALSALEHLAILLGPKNEISHSKGMLPFLLKKKPDAFIGILRRTIESDDISVEDRERVIDLFWTINDPLPLFDVVTNMYAETELYERGGFSSRGIIKEIILKADEETQGILLENVAQRAAQNDSARFFSDVLRSLPHKMKTTYAWELCRARASEEVFDRAVLNASFEGTAYFNSELPSIDKEIQTFEQLDTMLLSKGETDFSILVRKRIEGLKRYRHDVEMGEFACPYL